MNGGELYKPSLAILEITLKCNLNCIHCGSLAGKERKNELSLKHWLRICNELSEIGFKGITIFGGEPFLREDWKIISKRIKDLGLKISVVTNGNVNSKKIIPELVKLNFDSVQVSLDGAFPKTHDKMRNKTGSFEKAVNFVLLAKKLGLPSGCITTVSKLNFGELNKIKDFMVKNGIDWQVQEAIPIGRFDKHMMLTKEQYYSLGLFITVNRKKYKSYGINISGPHNLGFHSKYLSDLGSQIEWKGCWAGRSIIGIQSNGNVKGCLALPDSFVIGNARKSSVKDIWLEIQNSNSKIFDKEELGKNCADCIYGQNCKGGCLTRSIVLTNVCHNDPYCYYKIEQNLH